MSEPKPAFYIHREIIDPATGKLRAGFDGAITWCDEPVGDWLLPVYLSDPAPVAAQAHTEVMPISVSEAMEAARWRNALVGLCDTDRIDTPEQAVVNVKRRMRRMGVASEVPPHVQAIMDDIEGELEDVDYQGSYADGIRVLKKKRAEQAQSPQQPASGADGLPALEERLLEVAETVMKKWQENDRIPPMAWDFRGFLVDGMRAALAQQPVSGADGLPATMRDEFPILYDSLDALDERAAEQPERIAVRRKLSSLRSSIQAVVQELGLARARIAELEARLPQPSGNAGELPIELHCVADALREGNGTWRSCSGCHELNEGHDTGPMSKVFGCALGVGCSECGGIGAVWDTTDYAAMGDALAAQAQPPVSRAGGLLSDSEIEAIACQHGAGGWLTLSEMIRFGRAVLALSATKAQPPVSQPAVNEAMVEAAERTYEREAAAGATHEQAWHAALTDALAQQADVNGYTCTVPDDCETLHWRGQILSMNELAAAARGAQQASGRPAPLRNSKILDLAISSGMTARHGVYRGNAASVLCFAGALLNTSFAQQASGQDREDAERVIDAARTAMDASCDDSDYNVVISSEHAASLSLALDEYDAARAALAQQDCAGICNSDKRQIPESQLRASEQINTYIERAEAKEQS